MTKKFITIEGARQNNLKGISLKLPLGKMTVVTGVSGSGKSSLAFDTIYAEGQRRYVETFSSYARQFLDRMDKPQVDRIDGIPPAVAIDQTNPVRTSRSTVGTMTELNDHLKLLFAKAARLYCPACNKLVRPDNADSIYDHLLAIKGANPETSDGRTDTTFLITFTVSVPDNFSEQEVLDLLARQGYFRIHQKTLKTLEVVQDRVTVSQANRQRIIDDLEAALKHGRGKVTLYPYDRNRKLLAPLHFSSGLHCPHCDIHYSEPSANLFSFNSPIGACETCRGFGRVIGFDPALVVPDEQLSLAEGAVKPWQTDSYYECQEDLLRFAARRNIPVDTPWHELTRQQQDWVLKGEGSWEDGKWYGVSRFFDWLETKSYRMHIRVLLSKYRAYHLCPACKGARLKPQALHWRIGRHGGKTIHEIFLLPIDQCERFFQELPEAAMMDEAMELLLGEINSRLRYLVAVGLGYLTLDRQSRTLSGGEVQRINLTTALGASLVNTLFVLDEPSIGLHSRDIQRLIKILHKLRDSGNTLLVVEHDPEVIKAADYIIDIGPGPGEHGGEIVFFGASRELYRMPQSLTGQYLTGVKTIHLPERDKKYRSDAAAIEVTGARAHNLKNITVQIPLRQLVCVSGVSGSGKSTLIQDILYNGLRKLTRQPAETPGPHDAIIGHQLVGDVVLVDQAPIGKTARSNPASYVGAFEPIRKLFATAELSRVRGYTASFFSFNSGTGRCPTCKGSGFEHVEMQFLSDVYLRCPDCDGKRFRPEILQVKVFNSEAEAAPQSLTKAPEETDDHGISIADVLSMTVSEACDFFSSSPKIIKLLEPLRSVGLDYMRLGQPLPTLSGGEAQRLKLAGRLAPKKSRKKSGRGTLFIFDEPTTGLHFSDISTLLGALKQLLDHGHSVVVIEHNIDVIAASDSVIDLGPEGGDNGGEVVFSGTPLELSRCNMSHTGLALKEHFHPHADHRPASAENIPAWTVAPPSAITIHGAREHNLQGIDLAIPLNQLSVITGVSGSGKSTVAFDILFAEGQRRYLETLNAYARQFVQPASRPDMDGVQGVPPTVAIEQRTSRGGRKSTVSTITEIYHFLRLLFVKLGIQYCPDCNIVIEPQTPEAILATIFRQFKGGKITILSPLVKARKGYYTDLAKWVAKKGFQQLRVDRRYLDTDNWPRLDRFIEHNIELPVGRCKVSPDRENVLRDLLETGLHYGKGSVLVTEENTNRSAGEAGQTIFSTSRSCPSCSKSFSDFDPRLFSFNSRHGWCRHCFGTGLELAGFDAEQSGEEVVWNQWREGPEEECRSCRGQRLNDTALAVRFKGKNIHDLSSLSIAGAAHFFNTLTLRSREADIGRDIITELSGRLDFLTQVGLSYLTLNRAAPTLSGGEAQRIRLAAQLGSNLRGVCYILDEPTIGLHPRDTTMLLQTLQNLKEKGNTVVVVEHDEETIRQADHVIDLGPGGGSRGGRLIAQGTLLDLVHCPESITGQYIRKPITHTPAAKKITGKPRSRKNSLIVEGADLHNLKKITVRVPLGRLVCISGVSGSGKSTLVRSVIYRNLRRLLVARKEKTEMRLPPVGCKAIKGWQNVQRVLEVDQRPIGKTPRSCPATYVKIWDYIRKLFASTPEANLRGYDPGRFSFNVKQGRCPDCAGQGMKKIEMSFLPDVAIGCETCKGKRFSPETLAVKYKGKDIGEVLKMNIDEAVDFFAAHPKVHHTLKLLQDVGLGYLTLGQQSPTLSGGEAQRIKLVTELAKVRENPDPGLHHLHTLYILDEPTIGLHMADVEKLIQVLHRLVNTGNTILIIEHNLDIIAEADWLIDLGPEGGDEGGRLIGSAPPAALINQRPQSHTARFLGAYLRKALQS